MTASLSQRVSGAVKITFVMTVLSGLIQAGIMVVLARLLKPADYGAYALVAATATLTTGFVAGSLERSMVVHPDPNQVHNAVRPVVLVIAATAVVTLAGVSAASWLLSGPIDPGLLSMGLGSAVITGLGLVSRVLLRRRIAFGGLAASEFAGRIFGTGVVAIVCATYGWGAYALAAGGLVQSAISSGILIAITWNSITWRVHAGERFLPARAAVQLGKISFVEIVNAQAPTFLVGRLGVATLGVFNRAANLVQLPLELLTNSMSRVLVSGLVTVADDPVRIRRGLRSMILIAVAIIAPIAGGIAGSHRQFTYVVLGERWMEAAPAIPFLVLATWTTMTAHLFAVLAEALRRFKSKIYVQLAGLSAVIVLVFLGGSWWGLTGAAAGLAGAGAILMVLYTILGSRIADVPLPTVISWFAPGASAGVLCSLYAWGLGHLFPVNAQGLVLIGQIVGCGVVTGIYYLLFHRSLVGRIAEVTGTQALLRILPLQQGGRNET